LAFLGALPTTSHSKGVEHVQFSQLEHLAWHIHYIYAKIWDASGVVAELTWQTS